MFKRVNSAFAIGSVLLILAGCTAGTEPRFASNDEIATRMHVSDTAPSMTLMTMVSNESGSGGHSSLLINGSQTIMYDPAGRWWHSWVPERDDVLYGMNPAMVQRYKSFHARDTHHVVSQTVPLTAAQAEAAIAAAMRQGNSKDAMCAVNVSEVLDQIPGLPDIKNTWFPATLMDHFAELSGVEEDKYYEYDSGKN